MFLSFEIPDVNFSIALDMCVDSADEKKKKINFDFIKQFLQIL